MALTIAGIVVPGLFLPGVIAIDLGAVGLVAAAMLRLRVPRAPGRPQGTPR
jgi:hypothetical protein